MRHLISDEVGVGKTVQALMIVIALSWQHSAHRKLVIAPGNLLAPAASIKPSVSATGQPIWRRLGQRGEDGPALDAGLASAEKAVLPWQRDPADLVLNRVGIEFEGAV